MLAKREPLKINISFCPKSELSELQMFINVHWKRGHVLSHSKSLVDWMYFDVEKDRYNFFLAKNDKEDIISILGFVSPKHYDRNIPHVDVWQTIWKTREDMSIPGVGYMLHRTLVRELNPRTIGGVGLSSMIIPYTKTLGFSHGIAHHYYLLNNQISFNAIASVNRSSPREPVIVSGERFALFTSDMLKMFPDSIRSVLFHRIPTKSIDYIINRYIDHPIYKYYVIGKLDNDLQPFLLVFRAITHNDISVLRIVEFFGVDSALSGTYSMFQNLLMDFEAEYIDMYCNTVTHFALESAGFQLKDPSSEIIPDHFEPFELKNNELNFVYKAESGIEYSIFKGDSDQDRPNVI